MSDIIDTRIIDTRVALVEQKTDTLEAWMKDWETKLTRIDEGVSNHLTAVNARIDGIKNLGIGMLVSIIMTLIGVVVSFLK